MKPSTLVGRSLRFYWRTHLGVIAGCAVSAAVLAGALFVGDSVRVSLERIALARLGRVQSALETGQRFFPDDLARRLGADVAPALRLKGMAIREDGAGRKQVNQVEIVGVDSRFWELSPTPAGVDLKRGDVAINGKLASALGVTAGSEVALRIFKPSLLSRDAPLSSRRERDSQRLLLTVRAVLSDAQLGRFSLKSDHAAPYNAFVNLARLQSALQLDGKANLLVTAADQAQAALRDVWKIEDVGLSFRAEGNLVQLETPRVYIDPAASGAALGLRSDAVGALGYLVNTIATESGKSTPYSFVTGLTPTADRALGPVPADMKDDEILVNRWLADQISVRPGERVTLTYSELTTGDQFVERRRSFVVRGILEMESLGLEKSLVPEFPGLTDVNRCQEWDIGLPMDEQKLKDKANEEYWEKYRQTPKAFVTLAAARTMWANRFGELMAVRYPSGGSPSDALRSRLDPARLGLVFAPVREQALRAAAESMDLGQLFLGMSVFLIAASLVLTVMLFVFSVEQRAREMGVLLAVGYTEGRVRRLWLAEGAVLAVAGSAAGVPLGWVFARLLLAGLQGAWSGAVASAALEFHAGPGSAATGALAAAAVSILALSVALWRQAKRPVRELVAEDRTVEAPERGGERARRLLFVLGALGAAGIAVGTLVSGARSLAPAFFAAGALALVSGVAFVRMRLARLAAATGGRLSVGGLGVRNAARRPGRGMAAAGMLACGSFIVFSVSAMKEDFAQQAGERGSGTGGFALYGESSIAVHDDLNGPRGRAAFRLVEGGPLEGVSILGVRVREGDDASCLNLNQAPAPTLLGVDPSKFASLGAFAGPEVWKLLEEEPRDGAIPAVVGDAATAVWKLKRSVGKEGALIEYKDERGNPFKVRLVAALPMRLSILQGRLLISNRDFTRLFPSESGHRLFLVDAPSGKGETVAAHLAERLERVGLDLVPSIDRLREFYVVESAYLTMFFVLGGLGLLLGSAGMGVLVLRNVLERRGELALLRAVGYSKRQVDHVVMAEHRFLLASGLAAGTAAAALAILPSVMQPGMRLPVGLMASFLAGTTLLSLAWIWIATKLALRSPIVSALRNE